jgi:hypothetical protein
LSARSTPSIRRVWGFAYGLSGRGPLSQTSILRDAGPLGQMRSARAGQTNPGIPPATVQTGDNTCDARNAIAPARRHRSASSGAYTKTVSNIERKEKNGRIRPAESARAHRHRAILHLPFCRGRQPRGRRTAVFVEHGRLSQPLGRPARPRNRAAERTAPSPRAALQSSRLVECEATSMQRWSASASCAIGSLTTSRSSAVIWPTTTA